MDNPVVPPAGRRCHQLQRRQGARRTPGRDHPRQGEPGPDNGKASSPPAVRVDKLTMASLGATLRLLAQGRIDQIPVLRMITEPVLQVKKRAQKLARLIKTSPCSVLSTQAVIGGGSAPTKGFPSYGVLLKTSKAQQVHARLRSCIPAVLCRIEDDRLIFDMKSVAHKEIPVLAQKINEVFSHES